VIGIEWAKLHRRALDYILRIRWSDVRALGQNRLVRSSFVWIAIVPAAARIALSLKERVTDPPWAKGMVESLHLPFSWQLLFWAAVCFTFGTVVYDRRCPAIVRDHADLGSFQRAGMGTGHALDYAEEVAGPKLLDNKEPNQPTYRRRVGSMYIVTRPHPQFDEGRDEFAEVDPDGSIGIGLTDDSAFWRTMHAADSHRPRWLRATVALYAVGVGLAVFVFLQNVWWVLVVALGS